MVLGLIASLIVAVFAIVVLAVRYVAALVRSDYARGLAGGAIVGLVAVALPLTLGAGSEQLETVIDDSSAIGGWFLVAVLLGKMLAMAVSLSSGFIGGNVFPMILVGGSADVVAHLAVPDLPISLAWPP